MVNDSFEENEIDEIDTEEDKSAPRARNRTVMLTPDITGQVRARLQQDTSITESSDGFESALNLGYRGFAAGGIQKDSDVTPSSTEEASSSYARPQPSVESTPIEQNYSGTKVPPPSATPAYVPPQIVEPQRSNESGIYYQKDSRIVGFLVSFDENKNGEIFELRAGRIIVSSSFVPGSNALVLVDQSVSPSHAIMRISSDGDVQVLDQLSEFGTKIKRYGAEEIEELSGDKTSLDHGDTVMFGERTFHLALLAHSEIQVKG